MATFDERWNGEDVPPAPATRRVGPRQSAEHRALEAGLRARAHKMLTLGQITQAHFDHIAQSFRSHHRTASFDDRFEGNPGNTKGRVRAWQIHHPPRHRPA